MQKYLLNDLKNVSLSMFRKDFIGIFHGYLLVMFEWRMTNTITFRVKFVRSHSIFYGVTANPGGSGHRGSFSRVGLRVTSRLGRKIGEENEEEKVIKQQRVEKPNSLS